VTMNRNLVYPLMVIAVLLIVLDIVRDPWMLGVITVCVIMSVLLNYRDLHNHRQPSTQQQVKRLVASVIVAVGAGLLVSILS
jgi:hypothetical protein